MAISTSSIFHFTPTLDILKLILQDGFKITYCLEEFNLGTGRSELGISMISFSDIPISNLVSIGSSYGSFGIGLSKDWASKNRINPVVYMESNSNFSQIVCDFIEIIQDKTDLQAQYEINPLGNTTHEIKKLDSHENNNLYNLMLGLLSNIKNSNGDLLRKDKDPISNFNFYAEREWRFVPSESEFEDCHLSYEPVLTKEAFLEWRTQSSQKDFFPCLNLTFESTDISHILVEKESDIKEVINILKEIPKLNDKDKFEVLLTKITSFERLKLDY